MTRKLDVEKVDAALKRAAYRAIHGTRAERSGRFLPAKTHRVLPTAGRLSKHQAASRQKA